MSPAELDAGGHCGIWLGQRAVRRDKSQSALTGRRGHDGQTREHQRSEEKTKIEGGGAGRKQEAGRRDFDGRRQLGRTRETLQMLRRGWVGRRDFDGGAHGRSFDGFEGRGGPRHATYYCTGGRQRELRGDDQERTRADRCALKLQRRKIHLEGLGMEGIQGQRRLIENPRRTPSALWVIPRMDNFWKLTGPSQKEIAAGLQTVHDARNHAVDAPAQVAVPNATNNDAVDILGQETPQILPKLWGKEAGETPAQDTRPDASNAAKNIQRPHSADQGPAPVDNRPKPRPLAKNRMNGGSNGPDLATDRFNLSHRTQLRQSQDRDSRCKQPTYDMVPAVEDDEEPEYKFDNMPNTGYSDSEDILTMEEDEGQDQYNPFGPHANYSSLPMRRAPTPDSDNERPHSHCHSIDSPPRHVERPGSEARGVSEERTHSRRQSFDSPTRRRPTPEYARGRSPVRSGHRPPFCDPPQRAHSSDSEGRTRSVFAGHSQQQARRSSSADARCGSPSQRPLCGPSPNSDNEPATASPCGRRRTRVSPLPPSSLPPSAGESDSDDSSDEYGKDRATKQWIRDKKLAVSRHLSPVSDEDDAEDMLDFERAIKENGFDDSEEVTTKKKAKSKSKSRAARETQTSSNAAGSSKAKVKVKSKTKAKEDAGEASGPRAASSKRGKGKGKAPVTNSYIQDDEDEDEAEGDHTLGPVPTKIRQRVHEAYEQFLKEVETITKDCGKLAATLHQVLGMSSIKTPRALSAWNVWQQYWAETCDKTQDTGSNLNAACQQALITACGIDDEFTADMIHNTDVVYRRLPWLKEWHDKFVAQAVVNYREKNGLKKKLQQEMKPVIQTAHMIQKTYGVHVWGFVIDYHGDASYVFGAGDEFKEMNIELRKRGMAAQALRPAEGLDTTKSGRNDFRHQWAKIMGIQLWNHCRKAGTLGEHESDPNKYQMKWGPKFLNIAFESKCRIRNYPAALEDERHIIGRRFELKKIRAETFKQFMPALTKANQQRTEDEDEDDNTTRRRYPWKNKEMCRSSLTWMGRHWYASDTVMHTTRSLAKERKKSEKEEKKKSKGRKEQGVRRPRSASQEDDRYEDSHPPRRREPSGGHREEYYPEDARRSPPPPTNTFREYYEADEKYSRSRSPRTQSSRLPNNDAANYRRFAAEPAPARVEFSQCTAEVSQLNPIHVDPAHRRNTQQHPGSTRAESQMGYREASSFCPPRAPAADTFPWTVKAKESRMDPPPRHRAESSHRRDDSAPLRRMDFMRENALIQRVMSFVHITYAYEHAFML
ncbi:hypothetical protein B0H13DRAFT_1883570 [Mycena leptocephala]|nr:hypothetical protein B0H13DRAFT_1883570 [Mycena leptocephala]